MDGLGLDVLDCLMAKKPGESPGSAAKRTRGGGQPTFRIGDGARANDRAPRDYVGRIGMITEFGPGESEFRVEFEDGRQPTTGYLRSGWLEPT